MKVCVPPECSSELFVSAVQEHVYQFYDRCMLCDSPRALTMKQRICGVRCTAYLTPRIDANFNRRVVVFAKGPPPGRHRYIDLERTANAVSLVTLSSFERADALWQS